jgi:hypothetical protein
VLSLACFWDDAAVDEALVAARKVLHHLGVSLEPRAVPSSLARGGTVGRIGVPPQALDAVAGAGVALGATLGQSPLAPLPRLWRGLQRRCDVLVDIRHCVTLPGSDAHALGNDRDVILVSQRRVDRVSAAARGAEADLGGWGRARRVAELAYRLAAADRREVVLAVPPGRLTPGQKQLADACQREAQRLGLEGVRTAKAGLLAALLCGDGGARPWVVVSPMPMDELSTAVAAAIGDAGPWPVIAAGERTTFYDIPSVRGVGAGAVDPTGILLACVAMLQRQGLREPAYALLHAVRLARGAEARMRGPAGTPLPLPADVVARTVIAHLGRHRVVGDAPIEPAPLEPWGDAPVPGLRFRVASGAPETLRATIGALVEPVGLEVASVRPVDEDAIAHDVRVRVRLGEAALDESTTDRLIVDVARAVGPCLVEPWRDALGAPMARPGAAPAAAPVARPRTTGRLVKRVAAAG